MAGLLSPPLRLALLHLAFIERHFFTGPSFKRPEPAFYDRGIAFPIERESQVCNHCCPCLTEQFLIVAGLRERRRWNKKIPSFANNGGN